MCDHLHETTSRYDAAGKLLTFLAICRTCGIERVIKKVEYEPRPQWTLAAPARREAVRPPSAVAVQPSSQPKIGLEAPRNHTLAIASDKPACSLSTEPDIPDLAA
jgi:hypothetical protein